MCGVSAVPEYLTEVNVLSLYLETQFGILRFFFYDYFFLSYILGILNMYTTFKTALPKFVKHFTAYLTF